MTTLYIYLKIFINIITINLFFKLHNNEFDYILSDMEKLNTCKEDDELQLFENLVESIEELVATYSITFDKGLQVYSKEVIKLLKLILKDRKEVTKIIFKGDKGESDHIVKLRFMEIEMDRIRQKSKYQKLKLFTKDWEMVLKIK